MGLQSTSDQMAELYGTDLESTWAQIAYEVALRRRLGLPEQQNGTTAAALPGMGTEGDS
jgi:hypothetical protein